MAAPEFLIQATQGWARLYGDSPMLSTGVRFVHLTGLLVAGGLALAADRATVLAAREDEAGRAAALRRLAGTHSVVLSGLVLLFASGAGLFLADVETYWDVRVFWVKLTLIALLLANGLLMKQAEGIAASQSARGWSRLKAVSVISVVLWLAVVLASTVLGRS